MLFNCEDIPLDSDFPLGIGSDLTMNYGLALPVTNCVPPLTDPNSVSVIQFRNGSSHTLAKVDGSEEYISLMRIYAEDAEKARADVPRQRLVFLPYSTTFSRPLVRIIY